MNNVFLPKVHIFWEDRKILKNLHQLFHWQYIGQIVGGDFSKFFGLLRVYELYSPGTVFWINKLQNDNPPSELISTYCYSNCQTVECPQFSGSDIIKRSLEIDLEKLRQQVISPGSIKNHLTSAWGFSTIIASGYATGGM